MNTGSRTLHFQIGGHPAFMIPDVSEDYDTTGTLRLTGIGSYELTEIGAEGCVKAEPIQLNTNEIAINWNASLVGLMSALDAFAQ